MDFKKYKYEIVVDAKLDLNNELKKRKGARNTTIDDKVKNRLKLKSGEDYILSINTGDDIISFTTNRIVINYSYKLPYIVILEDLVSLEYSKRNRMYVLEVMSDSAGFDFVCKDKRTLARIEDFILPYTNL